MTQKTSGLAMLALLALAACGKGGEQGGQEAEQDGDESPPVPVETARPTRGDVYAVYRGTAPIEAFAEAEVIAKVGGEVRAILVEEGDRVSKGQTLARLDGDRLRLELAETDARLNKLARDFDRNTELSEKGLISAGDFEKIKFEMEALRAQHNLASLELDYTQIKAPIDGVVSQRYIKLGNTLSVNDPLFRITSVDPLVVYLHVPEREFASIRSGQPVALEIDALGGERVMASVTRVSPVVDPATGTFKVTVEISDSAGVIKPGMFARVGVVHDTHANALLVPRSAVVESAEGESVFVVEDGKAISMPVSTGYSSSGMIEIIEGIDEGDEVITVGQVGLKPDARVSVIGSEDSDNEAISIAAGSDEEESDAATD